ncbi:hypothetical protein CsSME_00024597 [Camellia sinensis var. sinensis]
MAEEGKSGPPDAQLFGLLSNLLQQLVFYTYIGGYEARTPL